MLSPGTKIGRYTIVDLLGAGGMGEVYRADDEQLGRQVAVKILPRHMLTDKIALERFRREARAIAALSHPNILSIFDFGSENGVDYTVTELLEGETLRSRITRGEIDPLEALRMMLEISEGVAAAHSRGIIHRDLKPENIFITSDGRIKVLDFGLARADSSIIASARELQATAELPTVPGTIVGTVGYLSPEQIQGKPLRPATDVFALGCVLYEMIAGELPFDTSSPALALASVLRDDPPRVPGDDPITLQIDDLLDHCLAKEEEDRLLNAGELANEIRGILGVERLSGSSSPQVRRSITRKSLRPVQPRRRRWPLIAGTLLVSAIAGIFAWRGASNARQLDDGYDVRASDLRGDRETKRLVELALQADAEGNRPKAFQLLEEACRREAKSAIPAAFLSSWSDANDDDKGAQRWAAEAERRLPKDATTYESLLVRYLVVRGEENLEKELALSKALLAIRPAAWRLRLAAAHIHFNRRDRSAALDQLQRIDVSKPDDRRLALVLSDRASLGDVDAAERDLARSRLVNRPAYFSYAKARIAWSRGNIAEARKTYDEAARLAAGEGLSYLELEAGILSGIASLRLKEWETAEKTLAIVAARARQAAVPHRELQSIALSGYAAHHRGDAEERDRRFKRAFALAQGAVDEGPALLMLSIRLGSTAHVNGGIAISTSDPTIAGFQTLKEARERFIAGDRAAAARLLQRARAEGIEANDLREEGELLAAQLGMPFEILPADPPYPGLLRYLAIFDAIELKK